MNDTSQLIWISTTIFLGLTLEIAGISPGATCIYFSPWTHALQISLCNRCVVLCSFAARLMPPPDSTLCLGGEWIKCTSQQYIPFTICLHSHILCTSCLFSSWPLFCSCAFALARHTFDQVSCQVGTTEREKKAWSIFHVSIVRHWIAIKYLLRIN